MNKILLNIAIIILCITSIDVTSQNYYSGFNVIVKTQYDNENHIFESNIKIVTNSDFTVAWAVSGKDTTILNNSLILSTNTKFKSINADTGDFSVFIRKLSIEEGKFNIPVGQSLEWLMRGNTIGWYINNFPDDSVVHGENHTFFFGSGTNSIVGLITTEIFVKYNDKILRIDEVVEKIRMPIINSGYDLNSAKIVDTFTRNATAIREEFNQYLYRYVKNHVTNPSKNDSAVDTGKRMAPETYKIKEQLKKLPPIGKQEIKSPCVYMVVYSYISCAPCQALSKKLEEIKPFLSDNKIQVVVINKIDSPEQIRKYHERTKRPYFTLYNTDKIKDETVVEGYPTIFLVDAKTEKVIDHMIGMSLEFNFQEWISNALSKSGK